MKNPDFKHQSHMHYLNGECSKIRVISGFWNVQALKKFTSISRSLGNFLEYSNQALLRVPSGSKELHLTEDNMFDLSQFDANIWLSINSFKSKIGLRKLT